MDMNGQVAVVTGAGSGLGREYALWLAAHGTSVVVNDVGRGENGWTADDVVAEIERTGARAVANHDPVDRAETGKALVDLALATFGRLDILVCNAGIHTVKSFEAVSLDEFRRVVDVNLWGTVYPIHAAWGHFVEQKYGRVVAIASSGGLYGFAQSVPYSATKASIWGLVRGLALDVPEGADIRVNAVSPCANTRMLEGLLPEPIATALDPRKVAPAVGWLASPACDRTGMMLIVGAGRAIRVRTAEGTPVEIEDDDFAIDWATLDDQAGQREPDDVMQSLGRIVPAEAFAAAMAG